MLKKPPACRSSKMNKKEIAARLASRASITNVKAQEILNHLFDAENGARPKGGMRGCRLKRATVT